MKKKILIFGGAGFIGSHFIDKIYKTKYKIYNADKISYCSNLSYCKNKQDYFFYKIDLCNYSNTNNIISNIVPDYLFVFVSLSYNELNIV